MGSESTGSRPSNDDAPSMTPSPARQAPPEPAPLIFDRLLKTLDWPSLRWEVFREGIEISRIYSVDGAGPSAAFLRYQPGARLDRHRHTGFEHILILSGSQVDDNGEHHAGTLLVHPPGTTHAIRSAAGCVVLAIWDKPVVFEPD